MNGHCKLPARECSRQLVTSVSCCRVRPVASCQRSHSTSSLDLQIIHIYCRSWYQGQAGRLYEEASRPSTVWRKANWCAMATGGSHCGHILPKRAQGGQLNYGCDQAHRRVTQAACGCEGATALNRAGACPSCQASCHNA